MTSPQPDPRPPRSDGSDGSDRSGPRGGLVLLLGLVALFVAITVGVLLHGSPQVTTSSRPVDPVSSSDELVDTDIVCRPAAAGTSPRRGGSEEGTVSEGGGGVSAGDEPRGISDGEITTMCDKARSARLAHALEVGLVGLVVVLAGAGAVRRRYDAA